MNTYGMIIEISERIKEFIIYFNLKQTYSFKNVFSSLLFREIDISDEIREPFTCKKRINKAVISYLHPLAPPHHYRNSSQVCIRGCWRREKSSGDQMSQEYWSVNHWPPPASLSSAHVSSPQRCQTPEQR